MIEKQDMGKETEDAEVQPRYFIDLSWYGEQERTFVTLAASRLCPASHGKETLKSETALLNTIKECCSKRERFVTPNMPLLEIIFRTFLANGNRPLSLEQLQAKLQQWMSDSSSPRDLSLRRLQRIINNDNYYGLRPAPDNDLE